MGLLDGKKVVVTGAGRGIGAAIARLAAQEGASVVVNDLDLEPAKEVVADIESAGGQAVAQAADIVDWEGAGSVIDRCVVEFGGIDGLVANAGMFSMSLPAEQRPEDLRRMIEFNSLAVAYPGLHAIRHMEAQGSGSLVNVTSSSVGGLAAMGAYGASKGAVLSLTVGWALDLQPRGVRVNGLSPIAMTRMHELRMDYEQIADDERPAVRAARHVDPEFNAPPGCLPAVRPFQPCDRSDPPDRAGQSARHACAPAPHRPDRHGPAGITGRCRSRVPGHLRQPAPAVRYGDAAGVSTVPPYPDLLSSL